MLEDEPHTTPLHGQLRRIFARQLDVPVSPGSSPAMVRRMVLLPDPNGPKSPTSCPARTSKETPWTAWKEP